MTTIPRLIRAALGLALYAAVYTALTTAFETLFVSAPHGAALSALAMLVWVLTAALCFVILGLGTLLLLDNGR